MDNNIQPKLSVIIPVYKSEKYIERCCKSLFEQTLDNIEYIFVDDCSPDNSVAMIREIAARYIEREPMVKILCHTPNRGVSFSRQQGLDAATGEFVIHCDSDDWVDNNAYEKAYRTAIESNADIVRFGYIVEYSNGNQHFSPYSCEDYMKPLRFNIGPLTGSLCLGITRRSILSDNNIMFPSNTNWGEDFCVNIAGLILSKKTICLKECFYHYWQNIDSITHTISEKRCDELLNVGYYVEDFLHRVGKIKEFGYQLNYLKFQLKAPFLMVKEVRNISKWKSLYPESHNYILSYNYPLYFRLAAWCITHNMKFIGSSILLMRDQINKMRR